MGNRWGWVREKASRPVIAGRRIAKHLFVKNRFPHYVCSRILEAAAIAEALYRLETVCVEK